MREILFKGKRLDNDEWIEGGIYQEPVDDIKNGQVYIIGGSLNDVGCAYPVDHSTVRQYTGLKDDTRWEELTTDEQKEWLAKHTADEWNGRPIFEGDIVDASKSWWDAAGPAGHDSPIIKVEWDDYVCGFAPFAQYDCDCGVYINGYECRVIGNVYDNPELLEK